MIKRVLEKVGITLIIALTILMMCAISIPVMAAIVDIGHEQYCESM